MNSVLKVYLAIYYFVNLVLALWALSLKGQQVALSIEFIIIGFWVFAAAVLLGLYLTKLVKFRKAINRLGLALAMPLLPWVLMRSAGCF